ncbi:MAG: aminoacyl-tRNA hydrolase [Myxococcales bacterium]|nr:aminoacyl-tRNA hydrolase [Myxococcales bacterium]MCB9566127.1 aminoacyl-tRNA hydrolase [Myxococcales bacterium]MCB9703984.1 aminoacyl-tRNA hydrolase [Myxococcales bacterium]
MADSSPWLIVGLGNPESRYAKNRHNVGFMAVDAICAELYPPPLWSDKFKAKTTSIRVGSQRAVVVKPQTYMNRSGASVGAAATFHRVPVGQILVLHDEIDFPFGRLAIKQGGGHGGHNGLRDIIQAIGSRDFPRIRIGVGRPVHGDVSNFVLSDFSSDEAAELPNLLDRARKAAEAVLTDGVSAAMNAHNG